MGAFHFHLIQRCHIHHNQLRVISVRKADWDNPQLLSGSSLRLETVEYPRGKVTCREDAAFMAGRLYMLDELPQSLKLLLCGCPTGDKAAEEVGIAHWFPMGELHLLF